MAYIPAAPKRRFHRVWVSILGQCIGFEKCWISPQQRDWGGTSNERYASILLLIWSQIQHQMHGRGSADLDRESGNWKTLRLTTRL